jgi:hypothetical protein
MTTLDKHADSQNWDTVGGKHRLRSHEYHPTKQHDDGAPKAQQVEHPQDAENRRSTDAGNGALSLYF